MNTSTRIGVSLLSGVLLAAPALAESKRPECDPARTPQQVAARVVAVDRAQQKLTVRDDRGVLHEFRTSAETLRDLEPGDHIEATLRSAPNC
jgi:hypothetical protein